MNSENGNPTALHAVVAAVREWHAANRRWLGALTTSVALMLLPAMIASILEPNDPLLKWMVIPGLVGFVISFFVALVIAMDTETVTARAFVQIVIIVLGIVIVGGSIHWLLSIFHAVPA